MNPTRENKMNVGTKAHPMYLDARAAVALFYMGGGVGGHYVVQRSEHINALLIRGLLRQTRTMSHDNKIEVTPTHKAYLATRRMRKSIF